MTVLVSGFSLTIRTEARAVRNLVDKAAARAAAEAGVSLAVIDLLGPQAQPRFARDGSPQEITFERFALEVRIQDESGRVDLNAADRALLVALFESAGLELEVAEALADAVEDWRDPDDLRRDQGAEDSDYEAAGRTHGAKDAEFETVEELRAVLGMTAAVYDYLRPLVTVYSKQKGINPRFASEAVLRALPEWDEPTVTTFLEQRREFREAGLPPPELPAGRHGGAKAGGTYRVFAQASAASGVRAAVEVVLTPVAGVVGGYRVLSWREDVPGTANHPAGEAEREVLESAHKVRDMLPSVRVQSAWIS